MLSSLFDCWGGDLSVNNPPVNSQSSHFCNTEEKKRIMLFHQSGNHFARWEQFYLLCKCTKGCRYYH